MRRAIYLIIFSLLFTNSIFVHGKLIDRVSPDSWYFKLDKSLSERITQKFGITLKEGLYYNNQRSVWHREDITAKALIDFDVFNSPQFGNGPVYIGYSHRNFFSQRELWLITPDKKKFHLTTLNMTTSEVAQHNIFSTPQYWHPVSSGVLVFDTEYVMSFISHSKDHEFVPFESTKDLDLKAYFKAFDKFKKPLYYFDGTNNRMLIMATKPSTSNYGIYAIDFNNFKTELVKDNASWPLHFSNRGVFYSENTNLVYCELNLQTWSKTGTMNSCDPKVLYTLNQKKSDGTYDDAYIFESDNLFITRVNALGKSIYYTINKESQISRYKGETSRFAPTTSQDDELMAEVEHIELIGALNNGSQSSLYSQGPVNRFLADKLGSKNSTWAILRYHEGQMPEELVSSFAWNILTHAQSVSDDIKDIDRVWMVTADLLLDLEDQEKIRDELQNLQDVVRGRKGILYLKDFPTILGSEASSKAGVLQLFWKTFRSCIEEGLCRVVMSVREDVYQKLGNSLQDIWSKGDSFVLPKITKDQKKAVSRYALRDLEQVKNIRLDDEALTFIMDYVIKTGRIKESPKNELDLFQDLFTFVSTYHPDAKVIDRTVGRSWINHIRGIDELRNSIDIEGLRKFLKRKVVSHDDVIDAISDGLKPVVNGTHFGSKPLAFFALIGTPGVGKTYIAKLVSEYLVGPDSVLMVDMRAFNGFQKNDPVSQALRSSKNQIRVVVFDDVDQVGPKQVDLLAGIIEEGRYAQGTDNELSFSNTIIIWTANWGEQIIRDQTSSNDSLRQQLRRYLTESKDGNPPQMRRRIWSRIESHLFALRPFTEKQLFELALVVTRDHIEMLKQIKGVDLKVDPRLLIKLVSYEQEAQAGARSIIAQLEENIFSQYMDTIANPNVRKIVLLEMNSDVEVFSDLDSDFEEAWDYVDEINDDNIDDFISKYGDDL